MRKAIVHLKKDPAMARVIEAVGPYRLVARTDGTHFEHVARAIVYQQLSGKAARTIHERVLALYGGRAPAPADLLATPDAELRAAGLSRQKAAYLKDLAARVESGEVPVALLERMTDDEVIAALTRVKGVGVWTAQMFLMFRLQRVDVLPSLDLGIQVAVQKAYRLRKRPTPKKVEELGRRWRPYATVASWYLWRSLDGGAEL